MPSVSNRSRQFLPDNDRSILSRNNSEISTISLEGNNPDNSNPSELSGSKSNHRIKKTFVLKTQKTQAPEKKDLEIIEEWGFKNDAAKEAFHYRLQKDRKRREKKKVLTAADRLAQFKKKCG